MKKVISIVLALLMMIPMAAMLVPTASAATATITGTANNGKGEGGYVFYEEDFEDIDASLVDKDLAAAIGWKAPGTGNTMLVEVDETGDQKLRVVSQYTEKGYIPRDENSGWNGGYASPVVNSAKLSGSAFVLEYNFTYNRREAKEENNLTVTTKDGTTKTVKADGQGGYQFAAFTMTRTADLPTEEVILGRVDLNGKHSNSWKFWNTDGKWAWYNNPLTRSNDVLKTGEAVTLEYYNNLGDQNGTNNLSSITDIEHSVKVFVDPTNKNLEVYVDGNHYLSFTTSWRDDNLGGADAFYKAFHGSIQFWSKPGMDTTLDDIKISQYNPGLAISEIMMNGTLVNANGKYQWVELTNYNDTPVNVYDYAIHMNDNPVRGHVMGNETDNGTAAYAKNAASTVGYFTPGAKALGEETFDSPAYEDGVLAAGESAIVLIPQTAMAGGLSVTDEAFRSYLKGLGMADGVKLFVCDNESEYDFSIGSAINENVFMSIHRVNNTATDGGYKPVAVGTGKDTYDLWKYASSQAIISSKHNTSGTAFQGHTIALMFGKYLPAGSQQDIFKIAEDKSYEVSYNWQNETNRLSEIGFQKYMANQTRKNANGEDVYATPGFVPVDCRPVVYNTVTDTDGNTTIMEARLFTNTITVDTPRVVGYDTRVIVNGKVEVAKATADVTTVELDYKITNTNTLDVKVELYREGSGFIGYQTTAVDEDGYYNLRLLAAVNSFEDYEKLGFRIALNDGINETEAKEYEVQYVYTAVTAYEDGSEEIVEAGDYKSNYLYALHINGISADDYAGLSISVEAIYMIDGEWQTGADGSNGFFEIVLD